VTRTPLCLQWLKQSLNFWNKIVATPTDLAGMILEESFNSNCGWVSDLRKALTMLGSSQDLHTLEPLDVEYIMAEVVAAWSYEYPTVDNSVRNIPDEQHEGFKRIRYQKWFARTTTNGTVVMPFTMALQSKEHIHTVAQFRMGAAYWLNCERRFLKGVYQPRSTRICNLCTFGKTEDEMHIFECPFYNSIRLRFRHMFTDYVREYYGDNDLTVWSVHFNDDAFNYFMNGNKSKTSWRNLARFLVACRKARAEQLDKLKPPHVTEPPERGSLST
jgi:hypothetical protein